MRAAGRRRFELEAAPRGGRPLEPHLRHARGAQRAHASAQVRRFYDRELASLALRLYAQDYDAFGLPRPNVDSFRS